MLRGCVESLELEAGAGVRTWLVAFVNGAGSRGQGRLVNSDGTGVGARVAAILLLMGCTVGAGARALVVASTAVLGQGFDAGGMQGCGEGGWQGHGSASADACWLLAEGHGPGLLVLVWRWNLGGVLLDAATNLDGTGAGAETAAARLLRAAGCVAG